MPPKKKETSVEKAQRNHLNFCEQWLGSLPTVNGIPVSQALSYDLIQILNSIWQKEQSNE